MTTINRLSAIDSLQGGDQLPIYDSSNGDARRVSINTLSEYIQVQDVDSSTVSYTQDGTGAVTSNVKAKLDDVISVKDFGAVGNGTTDDSSAIQAAIDAATAVSGSVWFPAGVYKCLGLSLTCDLDMDIGALLLSGFVESTSHVTDLFPTPIITVDAGNLKIGRLNLSGNNQAGIGIKFPVVAAKSQVEYIKCQNFYNNGDNGRPLDGGSIGDQTYRQYGVLSYASDCTFDRLVFVDCKHGPSFVRGVSGDYQWPQCVTLGYDSTAGSGASRNSIGDIHIRYGVDGLVHATYGHNSVGSIHATSMQDQCIYVISAETGNAESGELRVGEVFYNSTSGSGYSGEEAVVVAGRARFYCGTITHVGKGSAVLGVDDCNACHVGEVNVVPDINGYSPTIAVRTRNSNSASGLVSIDRITGYMTAGAAPISFDYGTVEYLTIGGCHLTYIYDNTVLTSRDNFMKFTACEGYTIRDMTINIIEKTGQTPLTSSQYFRVTCPLTNITKASRWENNNFYVFKSDGVTPSDGFLRILYLAHPSVIATNVQWQVSAGGASTGPYGREATYLGGANNATNTNVARGFFRAGTVLQIADALTAPFATRFTFDLESALAITAAVSATSISVTDATGVLVGDFIGVRNDSNTTLWTTVSSVSGTTIGITDAITTNSSAGKEVWFNRAVEI